MLTPFPRKAFARELLVWERLSHFNLLPLLAFRFDSTDGLLQFISPYAEPGNVSRYLKNTNPDMTTRLQLVRRRLPPNFSEFTASTLSHWIPQRGSRICTKERHVMGISKGYLQSLALFPLRSNPGSQIRRTSSFSSWTAVQLLLSVTSAYPKSRKTCLRALPRLLLTPKGLSYTKVRN